jgi:hypothetical protein
MTNNEIDAIVGAIWNQLEALHEIGDTHEYDLLAGALHSFEEMLGDE